MINHSPIIFTDLRPAPAKARARKSDPVESHDAAKRVELGKAERQRRSIYTALEMDGPMIVREISIAIGLTEHDVGRRIGEIEGISPTGESRNGSRVWAVL